MTDWLFQANPKRYDLLGAAKSGFDDNWSMNQHRDKVSVGDQVFFFVSGLSAGVYLVGRVVSPVYDDGDADEFGRWKVDVEYEAFVDPPLLRAELIDKAAEPILSAYRPFYGQQRTNFLLPASVAERLKELVTTRLAPIERQPGQGFDQSAHAVDGALKHHNLHVEQELLKLIKQVDPTEFEHLIKRLLERLGYEDPVVRGKSGDGAVDVYAVLKLHGMTAVPTIIQAKRWAKNVPGKVVRELRGALHVDEHGVVITSGDFTPEARKEAEAPGKSPIGLVNGVELVKLLIQQEIGVRSVNVPLRKLDPLSLVSDGK